MAELTDRFYILSKENENEITVRVVEATPDTPFYIKKVREDEIVTIETSLSTVITLLFGDILQLYSNIGIIHLSISASAEFSIGGNIMSLITHSTFSNQNVIFPSNSSDNFLGLFKDCLNLVDASDLILPAKTLTPHCYESMFEGCKNLVNGPTTLPAETLALSCYESMFKGCEKLVDTPACKAKNTYARCFANMFLNCKKITAVMPFNNSFVFYKTADKTESYKYSEEMFGMYENCVALTTIYNTFDHGFTPSCYESMFEGCTSLSNTITFNNTQSISNDGDPGLLKSRCCAKMYMGTSVTAATFPPINNSDKLEYFYNNGGNLTRIPSNHFESMYNNCKSITSVTLSNVDGGDHMFYETFKSCTSLTTINISFSTISDYTACNMFYGCSSLKNITLSIGNIRTFTDDQSNTIYASNCCDHMFSGCTGLIKVENTITFGTGVYLTYQFCKGMFLKCTSLTTMAITLPFYGTPPTSETDDKRGDSACINMFLECTALTNINNIKITGWLPTKALLEMFKDCSKLANINYSDIILYINGENVCQSMFSGCTKLANVSKLHIKGKLGNSCCKEMFKDCANLVTPPSDYFLRDSYPDSCYYAMFSGCVKLSAIETLKTIADDNSNIQFRNNCFAYMFYGCSQLYVDWNGIRGVFGNECCQYMFSHSNILSFGKIEVLGTISNTSLTRTFFHMFDTCTNLNVKSGGTADRQYIKLDGAGNNASFGEECFSCMFKGCTLLGNMPIIYTGTAENNSDTAGIGRKFNKSCFKLMFMGCTNMSGTTKTFYINSTSYTSDTIYANSFGEDCFYEMFYNCTAFNGTSVLNIIGVKKDNTESSIGSHACYHMYSNSGLTTMPCIKVYNLSARALESSFVNCNNLNSIPANSGIYATNAGDYAMYQAFKGNTSLSTMPAISVVNLGSYACAEMFMNTNIQTIGTSMIAVQKVNNYTFYSMFENCQNLETLGNSILPGGYINYKQVELSDLLDPANNHDYAKYSYLLNSIRYNYFYGPIPGEGGSSIFYIIQDLFINGTYIVPSKVELKDYTFARMFYNCTSLTTPPPKMNNLFYGKYSCYLMFANTGLISTPELTPLKYTEAEEPRLEEENLWLVKVSNGAPAHGNGKIAKTPTDKTIYKKEDEPIIEVLPEGAFCGMFMNTKIRTLPSIYAKKVEKNGCNSMFRNCLTLQEIPSINFNITTGETYAFSHMFNNCRNLRFSTTLGTTETKLFPNLTDLKSYACCGMFANCNTLSRIIAFDKLRNIADGAFASMYLNCGGLSGTISYDFSNITVGKSSFANMFRNCDNITKCELKFGTLLRCSCENMFMGCHGLETAKVEFVDQVVTSYALTHIFYDCNALSNVWCNMRVPFSFELTHEWLLGVAKNGIYHHSSLINENLIVRDTSSVPEGWTCTVGYEMGGTE